MKILAGRSNISLAQRIAKTLNLSLGATSITTFEDGELRVQVQENLSQQEVVIVQSISNPASHNLIELLLLVDTAKRAGAKYITAVIPYLGYSRQDRRSYDYSPISGRLIANILEVAGVNKLITVDLHSPQIEGFFTIPVLNLDPFQGLLQASAHFAVHLARNKAQYGSNETSLPAPAAQDIQQQGKSVIISPDIGGLLRARKLSALLAIDLAIINKTRTEGDKCEMREIIGNVEGKRCILIDDMVASGDTICMAAALLKDHGATNIEAYVTHPVLCSNAKERIEHSCIEHIYFTDTIETSPLPSKFHIISMSEIIARALS